MTILGVDLGTKRVGVAVSDESRTLALPLTVISFIGRKKLLEDLNQLVVEYQATTLVVGLPKTLMGEMGIAAQEVAAHVEWFRKHAPQLEWVFWDERLTSQEVERILIEADVSRSRRKEVRDKLAAQRILQSYLDFKKNTL